MSTLRPLHPSLACLLSSLRFQAPVSNSAQPQLAAIRLLPTAAATAAGSGRQRQRGMAAPAAGAAGPTDGGASRETLLAALAIPPAPGFSGPGARVEHVLAPRDGLLSDLLTEALSLPEGAAQLLLRFGAVHTCPVPPALPPALLAGMPEERAAELLGRRAAALKRAGNSSQARTPQRAAGDAVVPRHSYIRAHLHPKRFPACYSVDWRDRIVADRPDFCVVSKPAGVPAAPTVDNVVESAPACAAQAVGHPAPLLVTHRLDQCTEGLLVLGKSRQFVAAFNELVQRGNGGGGRQRGGGSDGGGGGSSGAAAGAAGTDGTASSTPAAAAAPPPPGPRPLRKFYRAATASPPPLGLLRHHLSIERRQLGLPAFTIAHEQAVEGSLPAELLVLDVRPISLGAQAAQLWGAQAGGAAHECTIELLTGRTHQIRAQLSAAGCPLLGDSLYQPLASAELRQRLFAGLHAHSDAALSEGGRLLEEPTAGIGLQACRLEVADPCMGGTAAAPAVFEAGTPWWRAAAAE